MVPDGADVTMVPDGADVTMVPDGAHHCSKKYRVSFLPLLKLAQ